MNDYGFIIEGLQSYIKRAEENFGPDSSFARDHREKLNPLKLALLKKQMEESEK